MISVSGACALIARMASSPESAPSVRSTTAASKTVPAIAAVAPASVGTARVR